MTRLLAAIALLASLQAYAQSEIILDNGSAAFSVTGTWPTSTAVSGYVGANYQTHQANGAPPAAIVVDDTDPGFSVTGTWMASTAVSGYVGSNYRHHFANGEPPAALVADNLSGSFTGAWPTSTSVSGYLATNYQHHAASTGTSSFTWTPNVASAGTYEVYARWTQHANRATNAKYTVNHAGGSDLVTVNQRVNGSSWQLLGTYSFGAGAATVSLSDDANGYVIADAVMIVPPGASPNTATWSATLPSSGSYQVYARWTQHPNRASNAKYTVNHSGGPALVTVNQMAGGGAWSFLGTYSFNAGAVSVSVTDQADGYVIADAVMFLQPGAGPNTATWTPNVAQGGQYAVYARWTQHANRASDASYSVVHAGGSTAVVVNQQINGGSWNLLGTFSLSPGTAHKVTLTDQANGYVIADAIRLVPVAVQVEQRLYFVHTDHLNTPRLVADATGTTVWRWDQAEPFGNNVPDENPSGLGTFDLPLRLPGQTYDKETGLHYNYFRDYDPSLGRYGESDPIGLKGGLNTYVYVGDRPLMAVDPRGLFSPDVHFKVTILATQGLSCQRISPASLAWKTVMADWGTQSIMDAHRHSMCEPFIPYAGYCESKIDTFIENELAQCSIEGLANALHATQDGFSSGHGGTESWGGGWPGLGHVIGDKWPSPETRAKVVKASRALIDRFVNRCGCCEKSSQK